MLSGNLRDRIVVFDRKETVNEYNEREITYQRAFATKAEVSFMTGNESQTGDMGFAERTMKFKVRYRYKKYNESQVIAYAGEYYNIRNIQPDRHRVFLILVAEREPSSIEKNE